MSASNASYSQPTANSSDAPHMPSTSNEQLGRIRNTINDQSATSLTRLKDRFPYSRPDFLQLTTDEIKASADHSMRPIIMPRNMHILPWSSGYAECTNAGKSLWNEDQAAFCRKILKHPSNLLPDLPYTYFGIFDGHAGFGAALAAARHFDNILHEKLMEGVDLLIPPQSSYLHKHVTKEDLVKGALESAFIQMDDFIGRDRHLYVDAGGCTACVALFINGQVYVANAGDSRAVLCRRKDAAGGLSEVPFSFDHTPESERTRLLTIAQHKPHLLGEHFTDIEFYKLPHESLLGQRMLCRRGTMNGWTYKTLTRDDLKLPIVSGKGKRSRLLGTLGVTRGFGDHDLLAVGNGTTIKPFFTAQPEMYYGLLKCILTTSNGTQKDGDYAILIMATDGLWDVCRPSTVSAIAFNTLDKYSTDTHRYTKVARELVAKGRGEINEHGRWRSNEHRTVSTSDDVTVIVIPLYPYYKEHIEWEQKCLEHYREQLKRKTVNQQKLEGATKLKQTQTANTKPS